MFNAILGGKLKDGKERRRESKRERERERERRYEKDGGSL
jgi:hypothetical protein